MNRLLHSLRQQYAQQVRPLIDWVNGASDAVPPGVSPFAQRLLAPQSLFWGIWWGLLVIVIALFCGQSSRFIYIDF